MIFKNIRVILKTETRGRQHKDPDPIWTAEEIVKEYKGNFESEGPDKL